MVNGQEPVKLRCAITDVQTGYETPNISYVVTDPDNIVIATGVSSSKAWVRHDAGGYHTKETFDKMYPQGWFVEFEFED